MPRLPLLLVLRRAVAPLLIAVLLPAAPVLAAPDYTWSGEGVSGAEAWSNGANWQGGSAPVASSAIGTLSFPTLGRSSCFVAMPAEACYTTTNDLTGLSVNELQLDNADNHYTLGGDGFSLGSGGLVTTNFSGSGGFAVVTAPIELSASQTWNVSSGPGGGDGLSINGVLSGSTANLTVQLHDAGYFDMGGFSPNDTDSEVGDVIVAAQPGERDLPFILDDGLNDQDGNSLTVQELTFDPNDVAIGPLISEASTIELGSSLPEARAGTLETGSVSLDSTSELRLNLAEEATGTEPGIDYSELRASGNVELGDATLRLVGNNCPDPPAGQVITLISSTGSLNGTFAGVPNGGTIAALCGFAPKYRITYNTSTEPQTVTATALGETEYPEPPHETSKGSETPPSKETHEITTTTTSSTSTTETLPSESGGAHSTTTSTTTTAMTHAVTTAQLKATLARELVPAHASAASLLKHGGLTLPVRTLEPGTLQVQWYETGSGAKAASKSKARSVLVAAGKVRFSAAGSKALKLVLTTQGKKLLKHVKHRRRLKLEAKETFKPNSGGAVSVNKSLSLS